MKIQVVLSSAAAVAFLALAGCSTVPKQTTACHSANAIVATNFTPMPEGVTSFGAVTSDGWLYVFGGHKGERHKYTAEAVSGSFHRLNLSHGQKWEVLPGSAPGQGLPLVAHDGYVYRTGGMAARNPASAKQDLHSTALVERFNPKRGQWEKIAELPAPRSSHDAVVVGNKLYIAGGWQLSGTNKTVWPGTALVLDLSNPRAGWSEFPQPFQRRALALAALGSRIFCIGGMDSDNDTTLAVEIYDTATGQWTTGPNLPIGKNKGFSCSAITQNGRIYASAFKGDLLCLSADEKSWDVIGQLEHPRMSHRLVKAGTTQVIALGGEDGESKRPELELFTPASKPGVVRQSDGAESITARK